MVKWSDNRGGYGRQIEWMVYIGDLCIINALFALLYHFVNIYQFPTGTYFPLDKRFEVILLVNLVYFICTMFVKFNISDNIVLADKIVQQAVSFVALYVMILTASFSLFNVTSMPPISHWLLLFLVLCLFISLWHILFRMTLKAVRKKGYNYKNIVIVGAGQNGIDTYKELKNIYSGYKILGFFDNNTKLHEELPNYLGSVDDFIEFSKVNIIDEIYCTLSGSESEKVAELINYCEKKMIRFHLVPDVYTHVKKKLSLQFLETIPVLSLRLEPLQHPFNRFKKRVLDVFFSLFVIIAIYPILYIIIVPIIKLTSSGPIHFIQKRTGLRGCEFYCIKFRSMYLNTSANKKSAVKGDSRITKIGAFMRKMSIDELPQFINVLKGDMSVVGPRPHMLKHTEEYSKQIEKFMVRHLVKPGITGWAQVTGSRGEMKDIHDIEERVRKDVWYIENWSIFLDLKIITRTILNVFKGEENAY